MMAPLERIYLDNAATSFPKPEPVYQALDHYHRNIGVAVGRGSYGQAVEVQGVVSRCRERAAKLLGAERAEQIVFTFNATDSLNLALHGLLNAGDHVVTSSIEHNSVLRPLRELQERQGIEVTYVPADKTGLVDPAQFRAAIRPETRLVALVHASNVTGTIQPILEVGQIARDAGILFLVDAAQTAGHLPIDLRHLPIDLLAMAGHKGLLGPLGTGLLYLRPGVEKHLRTLRQGGTGTHSEEDRQPENLPDKYESGNHNAPGLFGLEAGLAYLDGRGLASIRAHEAACVERLLSGLNEIRDVILHGPNDPSRQVGVVSFTVQDFDSRIVATILDENFQIQARAGLHCAPGMHRALGTLRSGGTVRLSVGPFTTISEINLAVDAIREVAGSLI